MGTEKIKPELNGVAETMLLTFYARAQYSKSKKHAFYDAKAVELVDRLDYDFSSASEDVAMGGGTIARTLVFDELVRDFLQKHPDAVVVNIACGLDTRVYRLDTGVCTWYNLDLPETIAVRDPIFQEQGRISTIGCSVLDPAWADAVTKRGMMLFIIEGLTMYLNAPLRGRCPEGAEGENLAIARNISGAVQFSPPPPAGGAPSQRGPRGEHTFFDSLRLPPRGKAF